jgi:hypothetical protein
MADDVRLSRTKGAEGETAVEAKDKVAESSTEAPAPTKAGKNYSRGEGQKTVTQAYKDNWNAIYGKKKR